MSGHVFRLLPDPFPCPAAFALDAYCKYENSDHGFEEFPHQANAKSSREAFRELQQKGWRFHRDGTATCPKCVARLRHRSTLSAPRLDGGEE